MSDDGRLFASAFCWGCGRLFTFDPDLVPSIPIDPANDLPTDLGGDAGHAVRQPVCGDCIGRANEIRARRGAALIEVLPGAYPFGVGS